MSNNQTNDRRQARATAGERTGNALTVAERSFQLLTTGPGALAVDGAAVGHGLPARVVDLGELRALLLDRAASDGLKDAAWRELVRLARGGDPAWVLGCAGVAMPGLKSTAARVIRSSPSSLADDIVSELLTEFIAQLARIDIERPHIAARLMLWARKGALRARARDIRHVPWDPCELPHPTPASDIDPVVLLLDAVRQEIITSAAAELIIATRLDGESVQNIAQQRQMAASRLYKQRHTAEVHLKTAIQDGRISTASASPASGR